jgi:hypothetical protein
MPEPLDFLSARKQLYPDVQYIYVDSEEYKAILRLSKRSGFKTLDERLQEHFPPNPFFDFSKPSQPINKVMPIMNVPPMSKTNWLADEDNRKALKLSRSQE